MEARKKILFIVNPISGDIRKLDLHVLIDSYLDKEKYEPTIRFTERFGHAVHLAREGVKEGFDILVAVGGDGSINEIANALVHTNVVLGIIPLGSGNGLAYHLGLPVKKVKEAIETINNGRIITIDTGKSQGKTFVSFAGSGFEAYTARTYRHLGRRGFFGYTIAAIKELLTGYRARNTKFEIDGVMYEESIFLFTVYNARYWGYKVGKVADASLQDGKFHVMRMREFSFFKLLWIAFLVLAGKMHWAKETTICTAERVTIFVKDKTVMQVDGDSFLTSHPLEVEIDKASLRVIVPQYAGNF
jgi:diacylglycerol kinase (ATP)